MERSGGRGLGVLDHKAITNEFHGSNNKTIEAACEGTGEEEGEEGAGACERTKQEGSFSVCRKHYGLIYTLRYKRSGHPFVQGHCSFCLDRFNCTIDCPRKL